MGNYWGKKANYLETRLFIRDFIELLNKVINNRLLTARIIGNPDIERLEILLDKVCAPHDEKWNNMVRVTVCMCESGLSHTFIGLLKELVKETTKSCHLLTFYALLVDVSVKLLQTNQALNISYELMKIHNVISRTIDFNVLTQTWFMMKF